MVSLWCKRCCLKLTGCFCRIAQYQNWSIYLLNWTNKLLKNNRFISRTGVIFLFLFPKSFLYLYTYHKIITIIIKRWVLKYSNQEKALDLSILARTRINQIVPIIIKKLFNAILSHFFYAIVKINKSTHLYKYFSVDT